MRKLKLEVSELRVESFRTVTQSGVRGTVMGNIRNQDTGPGNTWGECVGATPYSCDFGQTCASCHGTCASCGATCYSCPGQNCV